MSFIFSFIFSLLFHLVSHLLLPSCPVSSSLSSCLVSRLPSSLLSLSLSSFSVSLCLSLILSPCGVVCVLCCVVSRCGRGCGRGVCVCGVVWHAEKPRVSVQNVSVCTFKTSPCMLAPSAHVETHVRVVPVQFWMDTRRAGRVSSPALLTKNLATWGYHLAPDTKETLTHFQFENRSRTTCSRFLQSSALPGKAVQFQQYSGKLWRESATRWFDQSLPFSPPLLSPPPPPRPPRPPRPPQRNITEQQNNATKDNRQLTTCHERQTKHNVKRRATHDVTRHHNKHKDTHTTRTTRTHVNVHVHVYENVHVGFCTCVCICKCTCRCFCTCRKTQQHSKWNCVGANGPQHMNMYSLVACD